MRDQSRKLNLELGDLQAEPYQIAEAEADLVKISTKLEKAQEAFNSHPNNINLEREIVEVNLLEDN